jgi:hypothetical protein
VTQKGVQVLNAAITDANAGKPHAIVRPDHASGSSWNLRRTGRCAGNRSLGESPPAEMARHVQSLG